jgi:hypothetical protein
VKIKVHDDPHPENQSLVEVELETAARQGLIIPFPDSYLERFNQIISQNSKLLPDFTQDDGFLSFVTYKS